MALLQILGEFRKACSLSQLFLRKGVNVKYLPLSLSLTEVTLESKGSFLLISSHDVTTMTATAKDISSVIVDARIFLAMTNVCGTLSEK